MTTVLLKIPDVAVRLRCSRRQVYRWIEDGELRIVRLSKRVTRIKESEVEAFIAAKGRRAA